MTAALLKDQQVFLVAPDSYMGEDGTFRPYFSVTWPASVDAVCRSLHS